MDVVNIQRTIGLVYATLQQFDQSLKYWNPALEMIEKMFPRNNSSDCPEDPRATQIRTSTDAVQAQLTSGTS